MNRHLFRSIVITGASRGLGAALARALAGEGVTLGLVARDAAALDEVAGDCRRRGAASVVTGALDITDHAALEAWLTDHDATHPIDLMIANAGVFGGHPSPTEREPIQSQLSQVRINIDGTLASVDCVAGRMLTRGRGRIAIVSSLAALHPLADAPAYTATKAAVAGYGEALREHLAPHGIAVSVVYPGNVETDQTRQQVGPVPALMPADQAAHLILTGLARGRATIAFPAHLHWLIRAGRLLPWQIRARINRPMRFTVQPQSTPKR